MEKPPPLLALSYASAEYYLRARQRYRTARFDRKGAVAMIFNRIPACLANVQVSDAGPVVLSWQKMSDTTRDAVMIFGSLTFVTVVVLIWAIFFRKKSRRHSHHRSEERRVGKE